MTCVSPVCIHSNEPNLHHAEYYQILAYYWFLKFIPFSRLFVFLFIFRFGISCMIFFDSFTLLFSHGFGLMAIFHLWLLFFLLVTDKNLSGGLFTLFF